MRSLVTEAADTPAEYDPDSRAGALMTLIQHEMRRLPVTTVAIDLGYENPAAFTAMFKRVLGTAPRQYLLRSVASRTGH